MIARPVNRFSATFMPFLVNGGLVPDQPFVGVGMN
jgi:hypothetical protein